MQEDKGDKLTFTDFIAKGKSFENMLEQEVNPMAGVAVNYTSNSANPPSWSVVAQGRGVILFFSRAIFVFF